MTINTFEKLEVYTGEDLKNYKPDTSHFIPWNVEMIYQIEPLLKQVVEDCRKKRRRDWYTRLEIYGNVKNETENLVGWFARDPRLRSEEAYDCFIDEVIDALGI